MSADWTRIPVPVDSEDDRRTLVAILAATGLEVRIIREKKSEAKSAPWVRYVEFKE